MAEAKGASLTLASLKEAARRFLAALADSSISVLYGTTDGKAVGTYIELAFHDYLKSAFDYTPGNAASGIEFPELEVDLKVTSARQPQSSSPFRSASQKVYGLGHHLLVCVYDKYDDHDSRTSRLTFQQAIFINREKTADYQTTSGLRAILQRDGNRDDVVAFLDERNLPLDDIGRETLAERILREPPDLGYLTISNALQWRLQYSRALAVAASGADDSVENLLV